MLEVALNLVLLQCQGQLSFEGCEPSLQEIASDIFLHRMKYIFQLRVSLCQNSDSNSLRTCSIRPLSFNAETLIFHSLLVDKADAVRLLLPTIRL